MKRKSTVLITAVLIMLLLPWPVFAAAPEGLSDTCENLREGLLASGEGIFSKEYGAYAIIGLARAVYDYNYEDVSELTDSYVEYLSEKASSFEGLSAEDLCCLILAVTASGRDVTDVGGKDLTALIKDKTEGAEDAAMALIALSSHDYADTSSFAGMLLSAQNEDGSFALAAGDDVYSTAVAIQALSSEYESSEAAKAAVDRAIEFLSAVQNEDGSFPGNDPIDTAIVLTALCSVGVDPSEDERFLKNGPGLPEALAVMPRDDVGDDAVIYCALTAYNRLRDGKTGLLDMSDVKITSQVEVVTEMINDIPEPVALEDEEAIKAARKAYDMLSEEHKALIDDESLSKLLRVEAALSELKPSGSTVSINITIDNISYEISEATKRVIEMIEALKTTGDNGYTVEDMQEDIIAAYRAYISLTDDEKLFVDNRQSLEQLLSALGAYNHSDTESGLSVNNSDIPWNIKLMVTPVEESDPRYVKMAGLLGDDKIIYGMYSISFTDVLTGTEYIPESNFRISIPSPQMNGFDTIAVSRLEPDGTFGYHNVKSDGESVSFTAGEPCDYAVIGFNGGWESLFAEATEVKKLNSTLIAGAAALVLLMIILLIINNRKKKDIEQ